MVSLEFLNFYKIIDLILLIFLMHKVMCSKTLGIWFQQFRENVVFL